MSSQAVTTLSASTLGELEPTTGVTDFDQLASTEQQFVTVTEPITTYTEIEEFVTDFVITEELSTEKEIELTTAFTPEIKERTTEIQLASTSSDGTTSLRELSSVPIEQTEYSSEAVTTVGMSTVVETETTKGITDVEQLASTEQQYITVTEPITTYTEIEEFVTDIVITEADSTEKELELTTTTTPQLEVSTLGQLSTTEMLSASSFSSDGVTSVTRHSTFSKEQTELSSQAVTTLGASTLGELEPTTGVTDFDQLASTEQQFVTVTEPVTTYTEFEEFVTDFVITEEVTEEVSTDKDVEGMTTASVLTSDTELSTVPTEQEELSTTTGMTPQ